MPTDFLFCVAILGLAIFASVAIGAFAYIKCKAVLKEAEDMFAPMAWEANEELPQDVLDEFTAEPPKSDASRNAPSSQS